MARTTKLTDAVHDAAAAIAKCETREELNAVNQAIRDRWNQLSAQAARQFVVGQKVAFFVPKRGGDVIGRVIKLNTKTVSVREDAPAGRVGVEWRVAPGLLTPAE